jgi:hypothetical protein
MELRLPLLLLLLLLGCLPLLLLLPVLLHVVQLLAHPLVQAVQLGVLQLQGLVLLPQAVALVRSPLRPVRTAA